MPEDETLKKLVASRRVRVGLGLAGLAVVGVSSYAVTDHLTAHEATTAGKSASSAAVDTDEAGVPGNADPSSPAATTSPAATAGPGSEPRTDAERVAAAKSFAADHGVKEFHPVLPKDVPELSAAAAAAKETSIGSVKQGWTMRIITAKGDLTGQRELGWVAGGVMKVGRVSCSQTFQLANEEKPTVKPSLLVCWQTSATKSVATVAVNLRGRPSPNQSAEVIRREWRKLG
jgi:hypothetical protein